MSTVINIMSKNPDFAECKTRLKSLLSREERVYITKHMLDITCSVVSKLNTTNILHLFPNKDGMYIKNLSKKYNIIPQIQRAGQLSDKIHSILNQDNLIFEKKLVIGADIPSISIDEISECINSLDEYDCVFVPSIDGGFFLHISLREPFVNWLECSLTNLKGWPDKYRPRDSFSFLRTVS